MLETKFIKVAQSGPTVDGREIDAQDLRDMAETYSPSTYEAVIWPEHERFWGNHGTVLAVEARENGDVTELYAKLKPGKRFIEKNSDGQKLYSSIEIQPNFANTGKAYLTGIAITDSPASLGTEQIKFFSDQRKHRNEQAGEFYSCGTQLPVLFETPPNDLPSEEEAKNFFKRYFPNLFNKQEPSPNPKEETMTEEQNKQMLSSIQANTEAVKALSDSFTQVVSIITDKFSDSADGGKEKPKDEESPAPKTEPESQDFAALAESVTKLSADVNGMSEKFNAALPGTDVPDSTTPEDDAGLI
jgi:hypothetical protein